MRYTGWDETAFAIPVQTFLPINMAVGSVFCDAMAEAANLRCRRASSAMPRP